MSKTLYRPSELQALLKTKSLFPKKHLSQNFLIDGNIQKKIIAAAEIQPEELVIEIGPGPGVLTFALLEKKARVLSIEKDPFYASLLSQKKESYPFLEVFEGDFLLFDLKEKLSQRLKKGEVAKVVANLPYHITSKILTKLLKETSLFSRIIVMVQKEVALRYTACPGNKLYSSFTVFLNSYAHPRYLFSVSPHCFFPRPKVASAVIQLDLHHRYSFVKKDSFHRWVQRAFQQRRKQLSSSLKGFYEKEKIKKALREIGSSEEARPEELSLPQFLSLFQILENNC